MLTILMGRAKTGKSEQVLRRIGELGDSGRQILLVPEHASHQAEVDLCRFYTRSRVAMRRFSASAACATGCWPSQAAPGCPWTPAASS